MVIARKGNMIYTNRGPYIIIEFFECTESARPFAHANFNLFITAATNNVLRGNSSVHILLLLWRNEIMQKRFHPSSSPHTTLLPTPNHTSSSTGGSSKGNNKCSKHFRPSVSGTAVHRPGYIISIYAAVTVETAA